MIAHRKYADLHIHSNASDGTYSPEEILKRSKKVNLSCISITDHDSIDNIEESIEISGQTGIEVIPGVEFSVQFKSSLHILGYYIDIKNPELISRLDRAKYYRDERKKEIIYRLKKAGIEIDIEEFDKTLTGPSIGRPHIAKYLVEKNKVKTFNEAFDKYLSYGKPAYVPKKKFSLSDVIGLINNAGGIPVIAHPQSLGDDTLIKEIVQSGIKGIEVFYSDHTPNDVKYYKYIAQKNNLLITGGSDWHGFIKEHVKLGSVKLPYKYIEKIKEYRN